MRVVEENSDDSDDGDDDGDDIVKSADNHNDVDENDIIDIDALDPVSNTKPSEAPAATGDVKTVKVRNSNGRAEFLETAACSRVAASLAVTLLLLSGLLRGVL